MFGKKARRIAELELQLVDAKENLAVAVVSTRHPGITQRIEVRKHIWYNVSYRFLHDGGSQLKLSDLLVENGSLENEYFDGGI